MQSDPIHTPTAKSASRTKTKGSGNGNRKPILINGVFFESMGEARAELKCDPTTLRKALARGHFADGRRAEWAPEIVIAEHEAAKNRRDRLAEWYAKNCAGRQYMRKRETHIPGERLTRGRMLGLGEARYF